MVVGSYNNGKASTSTFTTKKRFVPAHYVDFGLSFIEVSAANFFPYLIKGHCKFQDKKNPTKDFSGLIETGLSSALNMVSRSKCLSGNPLDVDLIIAELLHSDEPSLIR
ncbi:hypothetical protein NE237_018921 [Protea cynaroides]|uniref:Uncharacterized protein n=1 Tax=Protea cynaroides TaxID=273540 RepID=A0A9Q0KAW7_9MAGN|nr:hypothetical protein NE237_018921 [Protea cynaroides]